MNKRNYEREASVRIRQDMADQDALDKWRESIRFGRLANIINYAFGKLRHCWRIIEREAWLAGIEYERNRKK